TASGWRTRRTSATTPGRPGWRSSFERAAQPQAHHRVRRDRLRRVAAPGERAVDSADARGEAARDDARAGAADPGGGTDRRGRACARAGGDLLDADEHPRVRLSPRDESALAAGY